MRVILDTKVWVDLKEDKKFLDEFRDLHADHEFEVVFSHGNFLDLIRRDEQDELAPIINEFTVEYLGPFSPKPEGSYYRSGDPLALALIDEDWYRYCVLATEHRDKVGRLRAMFRDADFDAAPAATVLKQYIDKIRRLEDIDTDGGMDVPDDVPRSVALKKIAVFAEYRERLQDGRYRLNDAAIPLKRFVFGMSVIYISETYHEPEEGDYRDALIWSQAISCGCDVLWTETRWKYEHPVINQVLNKLKRKPLNTVHDFPEFKAVIA